MSRQGEPCTQLRNTPCPPPHLRGATIPGDPGAVGCLEGPCAPAAAGDGGGPRRRLQVPPARTRCPGARCSWLRAWGSPGVGSSVQRLGSQVPGLAGEEALLGALGCLPALPAPSLFSHPLFRRHQMQLL